jgi:hypothetical protein
MWRIRNVDWRLDGGDETSLLETCNGAVHAGWSLLPGELLEYADIQEW